MDDSAAIIDAEGFQDPRPKDHATHEECTLTSEIASAEAEDSFSPFDEVQDSVELGPLPVVIAADGMPTIGPIDPDYVPALSKETLVCMGDTSKFVVRDQFGYIKAEFGPERVERAPSGDYLVLLVEPQDYDIVEWLRKQEVYIRNPDGKITAKIQVEPLRPQCRHYVRKQMPMEEAHDCRKVYRLCAARRTTEGTFMSVGETAVWACSMREPRDMVSEKILDDFDAQKVKEGAARTYHSIFNVKKEPGGMPRGDAEALVRDAGLGSLGAQR